MLRYKFVFHYTNGTTATVRNVSNIALLEMSGPAHSHPADLLLVLDKEAPPSPEFGNMTSITRTIISGETLCSNLRKLEVFTRPITKRSRYTHSDDAVTTEISLIERFNAALKRDALENREELVYGEDRSFVGVWKHTPQTILIN